MSWNPAYYLGNGFITGCADALSRHTIDVESGVRRVLDALSQNAAKIGRAADGALEELLAAFSKNSAKIGRAADGALEQLFATISKNSAQLGYASAGVLEGMADRTGDAFQALASSFSWTLVTTWFPTIAAWGLLSVGSPLFLQYLYHKAIANIGKPKMALEQRQWSRFSWLTNWFRKEPQTQQAFFNQKVANQIKEIAQSTRNLRKNGAYFQNVLLYGPPGTGKTMIARQVARESDMDFFMMSAGNLTQFTKRGEHVPELNKLLDAAGGGHKPAVIFIDEAEAMAGDRGKLDQAHLELLDALLARTGSGSRKIMLILATNHAQSLDPAMLSRMDHKILIDLPGYEERIAIINQYAQELFGTSSPNIHLFLAENLENIAKKTAGLSGRALFKLVNCLYAKENTREDRLLTPEDVEAAVANFVSQEQIFTASPPPQPQQWKWFGK